jgi:hypothetical protein
MRSAGGFGIANFWKNLRDALFSPLPKVKLSLYFALASCVLTFAGLLYAGQIFNLQRRDTLLFELERRHQEYERLLLVVGCLAQHGADPHKHVDANEDAKKLHAVSGRLLRLLERRGNASLGDLLDARDEALTTGSRLVLALTTKVTNARTELTRAGLGSLAEACGS